MGGDREGQAREDRREAPDGRLAAPEELLPEGGRGEGPRPFLPTRVEKPWGHELIWAHTDLYVGKVLHIEAGEAFSLQFHEEKDETLHLLRGRVRLEAGPGLDALHEVVLEEGDSIRIQPGTMHRMEAVTDCDILEASTSELDDVVRVRDRYGRAGSAGSSSVEEDGDG